MSLKLKPVETGTDKVDDLDLEYGSIISKKIMTLRIDKEDVNCDNAEQILDSFARRAPERFEDVSHYGDHVFVDVWVKGWLTISADNIEAARSRMESKVKTTFEDVFGVSCDS